MTGCWFGVPLHKGTVCRVPLQRAYVKECMDRRASCVSSNWATTAAGLRSTSLPQWPHNLTGTNLHTSKQTTRDPSQPAPKHPQSIYRTNLQKHKLLAHVPCHSLTRRFTSTLRKPRLSPPINRRPLLHLYRITQINFHAWNGSNLFYSNIP